MKKGDFVEVKKGIMDPDYEQYDMSGWKGEIIEINEDTIEVGWDIETLEQLPIDFIRKSVKEGYFFSEMFLSKDDVVVTKYYKEYTEIERKQLILNLEIAYANPDKHEKKIRKILKSKNVNVTEKNLELYKKYLLKHLAGKVLLTGIEDFPWEEKYVFGFGLPGEYEELKKKYPSFEDTFKLEKILPIRKGQKDLFVKVTRQSDFKKFELPLSDLQAIDEGSANYDLLDNFSIWIVNY